MRLRVVGVLAVFAAALAGGLATGCEPGCSNAETRTEVRGGDGNEYVCIPNPPDDDDDDHDRSYSPPIAPTSTYTPSPSPPPAPSPAPAPSTACATLEAAPQDVDIVPKPGAPTAFVDAAPPDGRYELVQASSYASDSGAATVLTLRATLEVSGAKLVVGTQATTGTSLEANESFTVTVTSGVLTKVCESRRGSVAYALFHGAPGSTRPARLGWNGALAILTLVMETPSGDVELLFMPTP